MQFFHSNHLTKLYQIAIEKSSKQKCQLLISYILEMTKQSIHVIVGWR